MKFKIGDYVVLAPPPGSTYTNGVTLEHWKRLFNAEAGGKMKVSVVEDAKRIHIRGAHTGVWVIHPSWVKPAEFTVNKLGNFPRKKEEVEL